MVPVLGLVSAIYGISVIVTTIKKPEKIWNMKIIKIFESVFGNKGAHVFFYIWACMFIFLGIWLMTI